MKLEVIINDILNNEYTTMNQSRCNSLLVFFSPKKNIKNIKYDDIQKYKEYLKQQKQTAASINSKLSMLKKCFNYALYKGIIDTVPYIKYEKIIKNKEVYLNKQQILQMVRWCKRHQETELHHLIMLGFFTGARVQNILDLTKDNIDNNYIRYWSNKTNKPYSVPISKYIKPITNSFRGFTNNYQAMAYKFRKMKIDLQLDNKITIHTLRHSFCSRLLQKGASITTIQKLANHSNIQTTMLYSHIANKQLEEAITLL